MIRYESEEKSGKGNKDQNKCARRKVTPIRKDALKAALPFFPSSGFCRQQSTLKLVSLCRPVRGGARTSRRGENKEPTINYVCTYPRQLIDNHGGDAVVLDQT